MALTQRGGVLTKTVTKTNAIEKCPAILHEESFSNALNMSDASSSSDESCSSIGSRSTTVAYCALIAEIRETSGEETVDGNTVYIKRQDGFDESISSVSETTMYSAENGEAVQGPERRADCWSAFNTIAKFILDGKIQLSGGKDCFKRLATPQPGVGTLYAGSGIYFKPERDMKTTGKIYPRNPGDDVYKAHISSPEHDDHGNVTNRIKLREGKKYLIGGDNSNDSDNSDSTVPNQRLPELLICHRGRLLEAGLEIPGAIGATDLLFFDPAGNWHGMYPLGLQVICSGCLESYANRRWPTPDVCKGMGHCHNARGQIDFKSKSLGYTPALAKDEYATCTVGTFKGRRFYFSRSHKYIRDVKRVLDAGFTIRDWDHLSEATGYNCVILALLFCSMPSLGRRLNKKGASFVPWASDSGMILGDYLKIRASCLQNLFVVFGEAVVDIFTGEKIKFEEDENGITRVRRDGEDFSSQLPLGEDGYVLLG